MTTDIQQDTILDHYVHHSAVALSACGRIARFIGAYESSPATTLKLFRIGFIFHRLFFSDSRKFSQV
ncbi:MAG: hypothetical protein WBM35_12840 [Candidatus Electrothrix sp.]